MCGSSLSALVQEMDYKTCEFDCRDARRFERRTGGTGPRHIHFVSVHREFDSRCSPTYLFHAITATTLRAATTILLLLCILSVGHYGIEWIIRFRRSSQSAIGSVVTYRTLGNDRIQTAVHLGRGKQGVEERDGSEERTKY